MKIGRPSDRRRTTPTHGGGDRSLADRSLSGNDVEVRVWREASAAMVEWEHPRNDADPPDIPADAVWTVERSSSPYGPWYTVAGDLERAVRRVRDDDVPQSRTNTRYLFYRVRWASAGEGTERVYGHAPQWDGDLGHVGGVTWGHGGVPSHLVPGVIREMRSRHVMLMSGWNAEPVLLYRPAWLAPFNPNTVNPRTGTYVGDWGEDLDGQGQPFAGGYDHPFLSVVDAGASSLTVQLSAGRISDLKEGVRGEFPYWPPVQNDDIVRCYDGTLAQISVIEPVTHLGHVISTVCQLTEIERTHHVNALPMPDGFREVALLPRRQAARPTNLESYQRSLERGAMRRVSMVPPQEAPVAGEEDR